MGVVLEDIESLELRRDPAPIHDMRDGGALREALHWNEILDA